MKRIIKIFLQYNLLSLKMVVKLVTDLIADLWQIYFRNLPKFLKYLRL